MLIPYKIKDGHVLVYLQKRSKTAKRVPGMFGFFGGGAENNETQEQALLREIKEELDFTPAGYQLLGFFNLPRADFWAYYQKVRDDFETEIKILEGDYGQWFTEEQYFTESKTIEGDKIILRDFFAKITGE